MRPSGCSWQSRYNHSINNVTMTTSTDDRQPARLTDTDHKANRWVTPARPVCLCTRHGSMSTHRSIQQQLCGACGQVCQLHSRLSMYLYRTYCTRSQAAITRRFCYRFTGFDFAPGAKQSSPPTRKQRILQNGSFVRGETTQLINNI